MDNKKWYQFWKSSDSPHAPNQDWNYFSKKFFLFLSILLFIFCSVETVQLVARVLDPEQWPLAFAAIGAFDFGIISWSLVRRHAATNSPQRVISNCMILIDLVVSGAGWVASLFLQASKRGEIGRINQGDLFGIIVAVMGGVIFLNVAAALFYHLSEPQINHPTSLPRPSYSAQVMPPVSLPQALENPKVAEVTTTKRQLPERTRNLQTAPRIVFRTEKVKVAKPEPKQAAYTLDSLLQSAGMSKGDAKAMCQSYGLTTPDKAYDTLKTFGKVPKGMTLEQARPLFQELFS